MNEKTGGIQKLWDKYKYVILVVAVGAGLLMWPAGENKPSPEQTKIEEPLDLRSTEQQIADMLGTMSGVGQARVMLTVDSDGERQLAQNTELSYRGSLTAPENYSRRSEAVMVDGTDGDTTMVIQKSYPIYRGAFVVCQGGDQAEVKLAVTEAVSVLTGLTADRIIVAKWQ